MSGSSEALCALCGKRPAAVRLSWLNKAEPRACAVAQYKLCAECSEAEPDAVRLLGKCDKHAVPAQYRASRPAAQQLRLM